MVLFGVVGELGCHDEKTTVFTPEGIKKYKDIKVGDKVFGMNSKHEFVETVVKEVYEYDYEGVLLEIKNRLNYNFLVTPNHKMIFRDRNVDNFDYVEARSLFGKVGHIPSTFRWKGKGNNFYIGNRVFNPEEFLKLVAWYICDGNIWELKKKNIKYFQIRKRKHQKRISNICKKLGLNHSCYNYPKRNDMGKVVVFDSEIAEWLEKNCGRYSKNKRIPKEILKFPRGMLKVFFDELIKGDGSKIGKSVRYYSSSFGLIGDFIELSIKCGYHANYVDRGIRSFGGKIKGRKIKSQLKSYEVGVQLFNNKGYFSGYPKKKEDENLENIATKDYEGKVWCFSTGVGNFFTFREGILSLSGNSGKTLALTYLGWRKWYYEGMKIYSNYRLYGIPYVPIKSVEQLDAIREGYCLFDELWTWLDSRASRSQRNRIVADILAKSRKRKLTIAFTTQSIDQIDVRIRNVLDFMAYPMMNANNSMCRIAIFMGAKGKKFLKKLAFRTAPVFRMYDTEEEVDQLKEFQTREKPKRVSIDLDEVYYPPKEIGDE